MLPTPANHQDSSDDDWSVEDDIEAAATPTATARPQPKVSTYKMAHLNTGAEEAKKAALNTPPAAADEERSDLGASVV